MKKGIVIIVIVIVAVLAGGAATFFLFSPKPPEEPKKATYELGDSFITNVKDSKALLKVTIVLEYNAGGEAEKKLAFLEESKPVMRNTVVFALREKTEAELRANDVEQKLKEELVAKLKEKLGIDYINTVYFNDFVLQ